MTSPATLPAEHTIFANRCAAGRRLAARLAEYRSRAPVVLALPRGGVPVAYEVAHALEAPLGVLVVRKIAAPGQPTLVIGAVAPGARHVDEETTALVNVPREYIDACLERERRVAERLLRDFWGASPQPPVHGRTAIIVDDGIVTGATARVALEVVRRQDPARVVLAAPVCAPDACDRVRACADEVVCLVRPQEFRALVSCYADFTRVGDAEIRQILKLARLEREARFHYAGVVT
ncbi:MAG TPA: phosphoribosyltransferase family protein [Gemmatimonadales bacterium]|nr:phosphoribosyltransferase family protein [Gemmatimonadales bacterium]